jgi:glyoxylase-like metal-dependent hydrolase (beta-lactamase superfamily II)
MSTQFFLLEQDHVVVLIEAGTGNGKTRPKESYWNHQHLPYKETLGSMGVDLEDVAYVFLTHLHVDHVGWATTKKNGAWRPTFPKARYVINKTEWDFWNGFPAGDANRLSCLDDSVLPLLQAGVVQWGAPGDLVSGLRLHDAAGHTPGQLALELEGTTAWFVGDLFHHPAQISRPDWPSDNYDVDQEMNARTRIRLLKMFAEYKTDIFGVHTGNSFRVAATAAGGFFPTSDLTR